jgi:hypothetical protein
LRTPWILGMFFFSNVLGYIYRHILKQIMMMFFFVSFFWICGECLRLFRWWKGLGFCGSWCGPKMGGCQVAGKQ